jgi:branched-chain amino acid transport system substrate-binding protein
MKKYLAVFLILMMFAAFAFAGCGGNDEEAPADAEAAGNAEGEKVVIGIFEPLTGIMAAGGQMTVDGMKLAHELYPTVTIGDVEKEVEIVVVDNKSDQAEATTAVARLIDEEKANVILGSYGSALSMAAGANVKDAGVPAIGCSPTNPLVTKDNPMYFRVCFIDPFQGTVLANYALDNMEAKKAALLVCNGNAYSVGLANYFKEAFTNGGGEIVAEQIYQTGDQDFTAQINTINKANPDVILCPGEYAEVALAIDQARSMGIDAPFMGGDTVDVDEFLDYGELVEGVTISSHFDANAPSITDETKVFMDEFKNKFPGKEPSAFAALGYDAYKLALDAITRAGSADSGEIAKALEATEGFQGATGVITLDENHNAVKPAVIKQVKDGIWEYVATVQPK